MDIRLDQETIEVIKRHGEMSYPEEAGGLLLGVVENGAHLIRQAVPMDNVREDSRHNRVQLDPLAYAKAEREAGKRGLGVWGYYHSHPDHPAIPSGFDLEHAPFVEWSYIIVSVRNGRAEELRAWQVREDRSQFDEREIRQY